jgi:hypothetical protein
MKAMGQMSLKGCELEIGRRGSSRPLTRILKPRIIDE